MYNSVPGYIVLVVRICFLVFCWKEVSETFRYENERLKKVSNIEKMEIHPNNNSILSILFGLNRSAILSGTGNVHYILVFDGSIHCINRSSDRTMGM